MFCILLVVWFVTNFYFKNKLYIGIPLSFKSGHNLEVNNILNNGNIYLAEHFSLELSILINYFFKSDWECERNALVKRVWTLYVFRDPLFVLLPELIFSKFT